MPLVIEEYMDLASFINSDVYTWVIIPALIFVARVVDVSIGTVRVIFISRGFKFIAPILGFFELLIWLVAIRQILLNLTNIMCYVAYAGGFATGTFVGMCIEERISMGKVILRIITKKDATELLDAFRNAKYNLTLIDGEGAYGGKVKLIFTIINRQDIPKVVGIVKQFNPKAFYSIEDIRYAHEEKIPVPQTRFKYTNIFGFYRKGK